MPSTSERFVSNPVNLDISRSKFDLNHKVTMTFDPGRLVPILAYSDVLPGDTFSLNCSFVCRSTTPLSPTMDDSYIQVEFYFIPHKLVLSRAYMSPQLDDSNRSFDAVIGAQDSLLNMPLPDPDANLPELPWDGGTGSSGLSAYKKSVAHYLGYPYIFGNDVTDLPDVHLNPLPMLAFYAVWNENYRDPNVWTPVVFSITSGGVITFATNPKAEITSTTNIYANGLPHVAREHGYFGSCLPWPQRNGTTVSLPLGENAKLIAGADYNLTDADGNGSYFRVGASSLPSGQPSTHYSLAFENDANGKMGDVEYIQSSNTAWSKGVDMLNLYADLQNATAASINVLRYAIQLQRLYEAWARGGNRIQDLTQIFGVTPHDMGDDRPMYLGGKRIPLNVTQVPNTAGTTYSTASQQSIGSTGAFSNTSDVDHYFTKSFDTWGTIIGVCLVRHHDSLPNMLPKMLTRRNKLDFYWPQFANLGEQPVYLKEISAGTSTVGFQSSGDENLVFGYQEAYAEYRYIPDRNVGEVNSEFGTVKYWTYGTNFDNLLTAAGQSGMTGIGLSMWLDAAYQQPEFDQTLQVSGATAGFTFLAQFYFDITAIRPMPLYSIPGLMDHH